MKELEEILITFINKHEITCPEAIYQMDKVQAALSELVEELCDVLGYGELDAELDFIPLEREIEK